MLIKAIVTGAVGSILTGYTAYIALLSGFVSNFKTIRTGRNKNNPPIYYATR